MTHEEFYVVSEEVHDAINNNQPVVALESTVITHGLPWPQNLETAKRLEAAVRAQGAIPATIALWEGWVVIGAEEDLLRQLAQAKNVHKVNLSNFAACLASGEPGSTTVAATMHVAAEVGIDVFATGGIGGVHRGAESSFDISADLEALSKYPVAVVCAGAKAILDLPKTVEVLETRGVPVLGWRSAEFAAFYRRESGLKADWRFDDMGTMAEAVATHWGLGFNTGILISNPIEGEHEMPAGIYERALETSLREAADNNIKGRAITPYLLDAMRRHSEGHSIFSNTALLDNNARVAAQLAFELAKLVKA
jgi:pseudouridine-5'-phosphate glycosidase